MLFDPIVDEPVLPTHREAYPAMTMVGLRNAWHDGHHERQWHSEKNELVARLEIHDWRTTYADIWYEWIDGTNRVSQRTFVDLLHRPTLTGRKQTVALCAGCGGATVRLYLRDGVWNCAACHHLVPVASLLNEAEKFLEKVRRLHREVNSRSPPLRGWRTYERKRMELEMMKTRLLWGMATELRPELRARVAGEWISDPRQADDAEELRPIGYQPPRPAVPIPASRPGSDSRRGRRRLEHTKHISCTSGVGLAAASSRQS